MTARSIRLAVALIGVASLIAGSSCSQKEPSPAQGVGARPGERRATMSAIDLSRTGDLARSFNGLLAKYRPAVGDQWPNFTRSMFYAESYADRADYRSGKHAFASIHLLDSLNRMRKHVQGPSVGG